MGFFPQGNGYAVGANGWFTRFWMLQVIFIGYAIAFLRLFGFDTRRDASFDEQLLLWVKANGCVTFAGETSSYKSPARSCMQRLWFGRYYDGSIYAYSVVPPPPPHLLETLDVSPSIPQGTPGRPWRALACSIPPASSVTPSSSSPSWTCSGDSRRRFGQRITPR